MATNDPNSSDPTQEDKNLLEQNQQAIEKAVLGENVEELDAVELERIITVLKQEQGSFLDAYVRVRAICANFAPEKTRELDRRITKIVVEAIKKNASKIETKITQLTETVELSRIKMEKDSLGKIKEAIKKAETSAKKELSTEEKNKIVAVIVKTLNAQLNEGRNPEFNNVHNMVLLIEKLNALLEIVKAPPEHLQKIMEDTEKNTAATSEPKQDEATSAAKTPEKAISSFAEVNTPEDIRNLKNRYDKVVTRFGRKPRKEQLNDVQQKFYLKEENGQLKELTPQARSKYVQFRELFERTEVSVLTMAQTELAAAVKDLQAQLKKNPRQAIKPAIDEKAEHIATKLLDATATQTNEIKPEQFQALVCYILEVSNEEKLYQKLANVLALQLVPSARKGKEIFRVATDADGKPLPPVKLKDFLNKKEYGDYGEEMVEKTHETLLKLYGTYGTDADVDITTFRDALIDIIKTRGGKKIELVVDKQKKKKEEIFDEEKAKKIYSAFLMMKDPHIGEKEALALLIAYKENPPEVYDLVNDHKGWRVKGSSKKGPSTLEDFCIDGAFYIELIEHLGMKRQAFNEFIKKIAPVFEHLRNLIVKNEQGAVEEINKNLPEENKLSAADLEKFRELMKIPMWPDKIAGAYKRALHDDQEREVPQIEEVQGADIEKLDIMLVNIEEKLKRVAERLADERLDQELKEAGPQGLKDFLLVLPAAWKGMRKFWIRSASEGYREKYVKEYMKRLKEDPKYRTELMHLNRPEVKPSGKWTKNVPAEGERRDLNADLDAIAERFGIAFTGERESYLTGNETIEEKQNVEVQEAIKNLCKAYVEDTINDDQFKNSIRTLLQQHKGVLANNDEIIAFLEESGGGPPNAEKKGLLDKLRAHKMGLLLLDLDNIRINLGTAKNVDVKTQVKNLGWIDKHTRAIVEWLQKRPILGRLVNPTTVAIAGFGIGNVIGHIASSRAIRFATLGSMWFLAPGIGPAVGAIAGGALAGGVFAAIRKNKETLYHKAQKERREALGYRPDIDTKGWKPGQDEPSRFERRMESKNTLYQKLPIDTLINNIDQAATANNYDQLRNRLAEAIARNNISELGDSRIGMERIDLIQYKDEMSMEGQRLQLVKKIAKGRIKLRELAPTRDINNELAMEVANASGNIINQMRLNEANFRKFKRLENLKGFGWGTLFGAGMAGAFSLVADAVGWSHTAETTKHVFHGQGSVATKTDLHDILDGSGNKTLDASSLKNFLAGQKGVDMHNVQFDSNGRLTAQSMDYLRIKGINLSELVMSSGAVSHGGGSIDVLNKAGFNTIKGIHFNDNQPHAPNAHVLDELRFLWEKKPELNPDGHYHFSMRGMVDPSLAHSHLPAGVAMPTDSTQLKVGLQVNEGGKILWKFFTPDSHGAVKIPAEFMDKNTIGFVPKGGDTLPGLKTDALAVGFDHNGTYEVLASVKGNSSYAPTPPEALKYTYSGQFAETTSVKVPGESTETIETVTESGVVPGLAGAPMSHLEYGDKKKDDGSRQPEDKKETKPQKVIKIKTPALGGKKSDAMVVRLGDAMVVDAKEREYRKNVLSEALDINEQHYYAILKVSRNATQDQIKAAYLQLARQYHPDKYKGPDQKMAAQIMLNINQAYQVLSDPQKRAEYDKSKK